MKFSSSDWEKEFSQLKKGWDSYDGEPISPKAIEVATILKKHLTDGDIVPTSDGGVAITWFISPDLDIVLYISAAARSSSTPAGALRKADLCDDPDWCERWPSCGHTAADFE